MGVSQLPSIIAAAVAATLIAGVGRGGAQANMQVEFEQRCVACHGSAARLAREAATLRDEVLYGVKSGQPISVFLQHHGRVRPEEIPLFVDLLSDAKRAAGK